MQTVQGPSGGALFQAVTDTAIDSSVRASFDALDLAMRDWQAAIVKFRCGLSREDVVRLRGSLAGWNCKNVKIGVSEVNFASLDPDRRARLDAIATRFRLPVDQVDDLIDAGRAALRANPAYRDLLRGSGGAR